MPRSAGAWGKGAGPGRCLGGQIQTASKNAGTMIQAWAAIQPQVLAKSSPIHESCLRRGSTLCGEVLEM